VAMAAQASKSAVREQVKRALRHTSVEDRAVQSAAICQRLLALPAYATARSVVAYLACPKLREVDTECVVLDVLRRGARLYVPVVRDKESNMHMVHLDALDAVAMVPPFGIREPTARYAAGSVAAGAPRAELLAEVNGTRAAGGHSAAALPDLVALPGLAFDAVGGRLGRGGGYYDKFLHRLKYAAAQAGVPPPPLVGLCFREQLLDEVPVHDHDQDCDWLLTPDATIECATNRKGT
jgi:5-formyltetrahydrofolate cyclo-ligase